MPELPEVHRVATTLAPHVVGCRVAAVRLRRRDIVDGPARPADLLAGSIIRAVERHGKQLALIADQGRVLVVQLGMTGQLSFVPEGHRPIRTDHIHALWMLERQGCCVGQMHFRDPRRFGGLATLPAVDHLRQRWSALGPDALHIRAPDLGKSLARTSRAVKAVLLDQAVLAGVGNIYADEALFAAGVHPLRRADRLGPAEVSRLACEIASVLARAVAAGGSTLRDYRDADGQPGGFAQSHAVYGRAGEPCITCGARLARLRVSQRTTVVCPRCQPRKPGRPPGVSLKTAQRCAQRP